MSRVANHRSGTTPGPLAAGATPGLGAGTLDATRGLATRALRNLRRIPSVFIPALLMPIFQVISFSGTYRGITDIPGFPTDRPANWYLPLAIVMGAAFAGVGIGFTTVRDIESGFYDRLRMAPAPRRSLLLGGLLAALTRAGLAIVVVTIVGLAIGARFTGGVVGIAALVVAGLGMTAIGTFWALGLVYRLRDMRAAALMQLTLFFGMFLTEAQAPIDVMTGWLADVARVNPFNHVLRLARVGFVGEPAWSQAWPGLVTILVLTALTAWYARRGLDTLDA